jgi:hypothetical protein
MRCLEITILNIVNKTIAKCSGSRNRPLGSQNELTEGPLMRAQADSGSAQSGRRSTLTLWSQFRLVRAR